MFSSHSCFFTYSSYFFVSVSTENSNLVASHLDIVPTLFEFASLDSASDDNTEPQVLLLKSTYLKLAGVVSKCFFYEIEIFQS